MALVSWDVCNKGVDMCRKRAVLARLRAGMSTYLRWFEGKMPAIRVIRACQDTNCRYTARVAWHMA